MEIEHLKIKAQQNYETGEWAENKCYYDISISRYYYCLYQKIIYISKKRGFYLEISDSKDAHINTISNFIQKLDDKLSDEEKIAITNVKNLRRQRNVADYKEKIIKKNEFNLAFKFFFNNINSIIDRLL